MPLSTRKIGSSAVHPIGFGAMGIAAFYGDTEPDEERFKVLDAAHAKGATHWDTANIYGDSEVLLGKWFQRTGKRSDIFLATKFGYTPSGGKGDPAYAKEQFNQSLERLQTDYVDLYYLHRPDANTPIETTVKAMAEFVKAGKAKYLGLSECTAKDIRRAHAVHPISAIQIEFSPFVLDAEDEKHGIIKTARELGITIVAYSPLARGLVTGRFKSHDDFDADDFRRHIPKYSKENFPKILSVVNEIAAIGKAHNATPGQVTLAWILAQGEDFVVIPGTKSLKYLEENIGAEKVQLSEKEIAEIRRISEEAESSIPGTRYNDSDQQLTLVQTPELK